MKTLLALIAGATLSIGCAGNVAATVDAGDGQPLAECCAPDNEWPAFNASAGPCPAAIFDLCRVGIDPSGGKATPPSAVAPAGADGYSCFPTSWCPVDGQPAVIPASR